MSRRVWWGALLISSTLASLSFGAIIKNPDMLAYSLGKELPAWTWLSQPNTLGSGWDSDDPATRSVYTLTGNGHAIYMCWDRAAFAINQEFDGTKNFTFTARILEVPPKPTKSTIGVAIKGDITFRSNVLDIRYDNFMKQYRWFNRVTNPLAIGNCDNCEKGDCQGTSCPKEWEGCLGQGYENSIPEITDSANVWIRITRNGIFYTAWYKWKDNNWKMINPTKSAGKPAAGNNGTQLNHFIINSTGNVVPGLTLCSNEYGKNYLTAKFDNIEYRTESDVILGHPVGINSEMGISQNQQRHPIAIKSATVQSGRLHLGFTGPTFGIKQVKLFSLSGKQVASGIPVMNGSDLSMSIPQLTAGTYQVRITKADGSVYSAPAILH